MLNNAEIVTRLKLDYFDGRELFAGQRPMVGVTGQRAVAVTVTVAVAVIRQDPARFIDITVCAGPDSLKIK